MKSITIELTDVEYKAMTLIAYDPQEWVENFTKDRARKAINSVSEQIVEDKLEKGEVVQGTKEEIVWNTDLPTLKEESDSVSNEP